MPTETDTAKSAKLVMRKGKFTSVKGFDKRGKALTHIQLYLYFITGCVIETFNLWKKRKFILGVFHYMRICSDGLQD